MSKINIERTIYGSLANSIGDDTIVYSNGSSKEAEIFRTLLDSDANKKLAHNFASLLLYWSPISRCHTFLHIQGNHVEFKADGRSFCTRGIYEISPSDMESIHYDYLSALESIPRMSRMERIEYGINPETDITPVLYNEEKLDNNEKSLLGLVYSAILNNKKLFIKIKAVDDEYKENNVLTSTRLRAIMKVVSILPSKIAQYASVAFSVDAVLCKMLDNIISPLIIAHHDSVCNWKYEDILIANWEDNELKPSAMENYNFSEDEKVVKEIARLPLLGTYMEQNSNKQLWAYGYVNIIRQHLDAVLDGHSVDNNDIKLLNLAYMGCEDKAAYRHEAMASKLYDLILKFPNAISSPKDTMAKIEKEYHLSRKKPIGRKYFEEQINQVQNVKEIEQLLEQITCTAEIEQVVIRKVCSNWDLIEDAISNNDKYKLVGEICKDSIHKKIVNDSLEKILKYYNQPYVGITIEDVKKNTNNWQAIYDACEVVGWGYATTFIEYKSWSVRDISEFNKWYNLISPKIDLNKQPVVLKLFEDLLNSLMRNKTLSQCCDIVLQLDSNSVFDISSIKPKQLGEKSQKKLEKIHKQKSGYYDCFKKEYERLTEHQAVGKSFIGVPSISNIRKYHLDYLLVAVLTGVVVFLCHPYIYPNNQKADANSNQESDGDNMALKEIMVNTDTLFFDADLNRNKISRGLLLRLSESVITRLEKKIDVQSFYPEICFYGDSVYIVPLINTPINDLVKIDSLLFGKSLVTTDNVARKDSIMVVENGEQKKIVLNGNNRLLSHLRRNMLTVNEIKIDTVSLFIPNKWFMDKYGVEPSSHHLLYYLFLVKEMEQFKKKNGINHELSY